jgi:hypothetical protein
MIYHKNVPALERALRIAAGAGMILFAVFGAQIFGALAPVAGILLIASAAFMILTGYIGWCPACWMVGRKPIRK